MSTKSLPLSVPEVEETYIGRIQRGNEGIPVPTYDPPQGEPERPTLPGHEHQIDPESKVPAFLTESRAFNLVWTLGAVGIALGAARWIS